MQHPGYAAILGAFEELVRRREVGRTMAAVIVDSPWLPGYARVDTLDFYFDPETWLAAHLRLHADLPGVAFAPGSWVEFGMAAEPSGFGAKIRWSGVSPPSVLPVAGGIDALLQMDVPDPERDGLMAVALRQYERMAPRLKEHGIPPRMAAARGPLAVASHLLGAAEFLMATKLAPAKCRLLLDRTAALCIEWLKAQLGRMEQPLGVLVLDDVVGMINPADAPALALPLLERIFASFPGLIHIFHDDAPNERVFPGLAGCGIDVFNFSHTVSVQRARRLVGKDVVLMGNIPPLEVLARGTPAEVRRAAEALVAEAGRCGPLIVSAGGGVSPGTPIENLKAMAEVAGRAGR